ncbi:MAG: acyl carrier protein [Candidatus Omnitrophica bacterium]|nr:acyl carrier protein [Candidatus Omnitrophota bacterium]
MEDEVCRVIAEALSMKAGSVTVNDDINTIEKWDSLGFLSILSALENRFGGKVAEIDDLASVKSVREIIDVFKREHII